MKTKKKLIQVLKIERPRQAGIFFVSFIFLFFSPFFCLASYDFYVNDSASESGDGSEDEPFETINEAIEEAKRKGGTQKIFLQSGTYDEDIVIEKKIRLYGKSEGSVIISGDVEMKDQTLIRNLTIQGGRGVEVASGANAEIENCTIEDFDGIGIETIAGGGFLRVVGSKIKNGNGKGMYIQRGKTIEIKNNEIRDNKGEEGIDLRSKIKGVIEGNIITDNGESGIEVIVGSADLKISNNTIRNNGSSGIATQFYSEEKVGSKEAGKIQILGNSIKKNRKYGIDCNMPHGGNVPEKYWQNSIIIIDNDIADNGMGRINNVCALPDLVKKEEIITQKKESQVSAVEDNFNQNQSNQSEKAESEEEKKQREEDLEREKVRAELENRKTQLKKTIENGEQFSKELKEILDEIESQSRFGFFFLGVSREKLKKFEFLIEQKEKELEIGKTILGGGFLDGEDESYFKGELSRLEGEKEALKKRIKEKEDAFSLKGFFKKFIFWK